MTRVEAIAYFIDSNERIISVAKDENRYNYETQQIEDVFMRKDFEAKDIAIKALEQEPRWIPCKLRLPEKNGVYIVSYEDSVRLLEWFNGKWFFYPSNPAREETGTITAWLSIPQPYKVESEE